jgi:hypothetical protein
LTVAVVALCLVIPRATAAAEMHAATDQSEKVSVEEGAGVEGVEKAHSTRTSARQGSSSGKSRKLKPPASSSFDMIVVPGREAPPGLRISPPTEAVPVAPPVTPASPVPPAPPTVIAPPVAAEAELPMVPPTESRPGIAGYFSLGLGYSNTGLIGRTSLAVIPLHWGGFGLGATLTAGLSGATSKAGWLDAGATAQLSWEKAAPGGRLVVALGAGPGFAYSRGRSCDSPLCGSIESLPPALIGLAQFQAGWWLVQPKGDDVGFFLSVQGMTPGLIDVTMNVAIGMIDLRNIASVFQ